MSKPSKFGSNSLDSLATQWTRRWTDIRGKLVVLETTSLPQNIYLFILFLNDGSRILKITDENLHSIGTETTLEDVVNHLEDGGHDQAIIRGLQVSRNPPTKIFSLTLRFGPGDEELARLVETVIIFFRDFVRQRVPSFDPYTQVNAYELPLDAGTGTDEETLKTLARHADNYRKFTKVSRRGSA